MTSTGKPGCPIRLDLLPAALLTGALLRFR
jgi:hypothetical protein